MIKTIPHKINLGLYIIEKMSSGYHTIETVYYPCDNYKDTIEITPSSHFSFTLKNADFDCDAEQNLCVKVYRLLQKTFDLPPVSITLTKQIPSGAGLGGGSADAALTLKMLNNIFSLQLNAQQLYKYAVLLGSDVPFFLYDTPMYATGRGEILTPIYLDLSKYKIEIICPTDVHISTAQAYKLIIPKKPDVSLFDIIKNPIQTWKESLINDFEEVIFRQYPSLLEIKNDFYQRGALYASLTGSGSALFGIFTSKK